MKTTFLVFGALLSICLDAFATTDRTSKIDVSSLNAQKEFLGMINECSNPMLYSKMLEKALDTKNQAKRQIFSARIEETIINNPSCFVTAVTKLGDKKCEAVEETFLREPYFYPKHEIYRALSASSNYAQSCFAS